MVLSYDLEDAIKNVRDDFGPFKVVRNNRGMYGMIFPFYLGIDYAALKDPSHILLALGLQYSFLVGAKTLECSISGVDPYYEKSMSQLKRLVADLDEQNISTDVKSLSEGEVYHKKINLEVNSKKIPSFIENKYILVPTYGFHGNRMETSFLQEHEIGSKKYVLSFGTPSKVYGYSYYPA